MNEKEKSGLSVYYMKKSKETFSEAEFLFANNYYNAAVNRLYYSCFYAVSGLLICNDINAKKHSGLRQMFGLHFISTGIIDVESGKFFTELFELRQDADYESYFDLDKPEVMVLFEPAMKLISQIEQILLKP